MNYRQALLDLGKFTNYERFSNYNYRKSYELIRLKKLLLLLDNPQERYLSVIISGTKGKGSTAAMTASILRQAGINTGLFTSPHLFSIRERIKINGRAISEEDFSDIFFFIKKAIDKNRLKGITFFEILAALSFVYFAKKRIDTAVLEVGIGGRLDATNIAPSRICAIAPISYDHTHLLGNTIEKIAKEKSGIIKEDSFVISAPQKKEALRVIRDVSRRKNAKLIVVGKDITLRNLKLSFLGTSLDAKTPFSSYNDIKIPLIGRHQATNFLVSLGIVEALRKNFGFDIREGHLNKGLRHLKFPGRFQIISKKPCIVLDGAHNRASAEALKEAFKGVFGELSPLIILGVSSDKDIEGIGKALCPMASHIIFTRADSVRALAPCALAERLKRFCKEYYVAYDIEDAVTFAKDIGNKKSAILITGSLFLVGDALKALK